MSRSEFLSWQAFYSIDPFGEQRADTRAGVIASVIANFMQSGKRRKNFSPSDFMLFKKKKKVDVSQVATDIRTYFNERIKGRDDN